MTAAPKKKGVFARGVARILLSAWVIGRVRNPIVLELLLAVARDFQNTRAVAALEARAAGASAVTVAVPPAVVTPPVAVPPPSIAVTPKERAAFREQAMVLCRRENPAGAATEIRALIARNGDDSVLWRCLGVVLAAEKVHEEAVAAFRCGLAIKSDDAEAHNALGGSLRALGQFDEAVACHQRALKLRPKFPEAHNSLGITFQAWDRPAEAEASYRRAVSQNPDFATAHNNLGLIKEKQGRFEEAVPHFERAVALKPDFAAAYYNLGCVLYALRRFEPALAAYERATHLKPDYAKAHVNEALLRLRLGDYGLGWEKHEWRLKYLYDITGAYAGSVWDGSCPKGKTILLHTEAGFGDNIQFIRFARQIKQRGARVLVACQPELRRLFRMMPEIDDVILKGDTLPSYHCHAPMMSLPWLCRATLETLLADIPYLYADSKAVAAWAERLRPFSGFKVGLVWAGNALLGQAELIDMDRRRSMRYEQFLPVLQVPGIHVFSLQKGGPASQARAPLPGAALIDFMDDVTDFADTAALVANLDLVIGVDTSCIHLAAALGKPVWMLSRFDGCWRWMEEREDSPWYPTLRIFRQVQPGDWETPVAAVAAQLRERVISEGRRGAGLSS